MIVDSHSHVGSDIFTKRTPEFRNIVPYEQSFKQLLSKISNSPVDKAIVYPFPSPLGQFGEDDFWFKKENCTLFDNVKKEKNIYFFPTFNPNDKKSVDYAVKLVEDNKLKGLKLHTRSTQFEPSKMNENILKVLRENDIPLVIHTGTGKEEELTEKGMDISINSLYNLAFDNSDVRFVFAHLGRLHKNLEKSLDLDNVVTDTAGMSLYKKHKDFVLAKEYNQEFFDKDIKEIISYLVEEGYEDKILWGSDQPFSMGYNEEISYVRDNPNINRNAKEKILYKNSVKWFKI